MQIIFKAIIVSFGHAPWWEITVLHSMETLDAGLVASLKKYQSWNTVH